MRFCCVVFLILGVLFQAAPQETDGPADGDQAGGLLEAREVPAEASGAEAPSPGDGAGDASHESQDSGEGWYMGKPIRDIVFEGLNHLDPSELEGITRPYLEKLFSDSLYTEILGKLYALDYFDTILPAAVPADEARTAVILRFTVTERPVIARIEFVGNDGLRRGELLDTVTLKVGDVATPMKLRVDELALKNKYLEKGFPDVIVSSGMAADARGATIVTFTITEGAKITLSEIRFEGVTAFSERTLARQLSLKPKGIIADGAFQEAKLIADRQTLAQYYHDRGYIDAVVQDVAREIVIDDKGNHLAITFKIVEGPLYKFGGITFEGNEIFSTDQLAALVYSKPGETANARKIQEDLMRVADLYYENGYLFNRIDPLENKDSEAGTLGYVISITERERAHIENIIIKWNGAHKTRDEVVLREIPLETGDVFSKTKVMEGLRNLYNLQYFGTEIYPETPQGSAENLMDLVINLQEQPTTEFTAGLSFSGTADPDAFPLSLMVSINNRNFRGTGNTLGGEINASPDTQSGSVNYTQRWMFGLPLSASFDLTLQHAARSAAMDSRAPFWNGDETGVAYPDGFDDYDDYYSASSIPSEYLMEYDWWKISLGASTGYRWYTPLGNFTLSGGPRLAIELSSYDTDEYRPFDPVLRAQNSQWTPATSIWTSAALDQRDLSYDPSRGYYVVQRAGLYGLLPGEVETERYLRTDTKAEWFTTLLNLPVSDNWSFKVVFGLHSGLSMLFPQPGRADAVVASASRLAIDGMFNARGWTAEYKNKGLAMWENWAELRIPLAPGILAWDFYLDAAEVSDAPETIFGNDVDGTFAERLRFSLGGGLRFTIPQFPFRFSVGRRFRLVDGKVDWIDGNMGGGLDFVLSFALSSY